MTRIRFYHNAPDPFALACELVGRAYASGRQVAIRVADPAAAQHLDRQLWSFDQLSFVPHARIGDTLAEGAPVLIGYAGMREPWPCQDLLFNLAHDPPPDLDRFRQLVEIVGQQESDKQPARQRWALYRRQGHALKAFDAVRREAL